MTEITELDLEQIANLIKDGFTSGRLDCDEGKYIAWELKMNAWEDD